jgi:hypothetical protein
MLRPASGSQWALRLLKAPIAPHLESRSRAKPINAYASLA